MISIIFFGTPDFVLPIPQALLEAGHQLSAIITAPDRPVGRHKTLTSSPVKSWAQKHQISVFTPEILNSEFIRQLADNLAPLKPDIIVLAAYGKILPAELLELPKHGALCVHPSLLPKYRGASPVPTAILSGDKETGVSIIKMDEKVDHGPIIAQVKEPILPTDTSETLHQRLFKIGAQLLLQNVNQYIKGEIKLTEQNHAQVTFTKILKREDGYIDLSNPPSLEVFERMIRAYHPWPGVWTRWNNKIVKFLPSRHPERSVKDLSQMRVSNNGSTSLATGLKDSSSAEWRTQNDKFLIQMEGKKAMPLKDFLNGYPNFPFMK